MSNKWSWVFGILTAAAFIFGVIFFAATQQISGRDWVVLGIGVLIGATAAALAATFVFHADARTNRLASERSISEAAAKAESSRRDSESLAERTRLDLLAAAERASLEKKTMLLAALPTRKERLGELHREIGETEMNIAVAHGNAASEKISAQTSASYNFNDIAHQQLASARTWEIAEADGKRKLPGLEAERDRLEAMSDEDYLAEQKHQRGLD